MGDAEIIDDVLEMLSEVYLHACLAMRTTQSHDIQI